MAYVAIAIAIFVCYEFLLVWKELSPSGFMSLLKGSSFGYWSICVGWRSFGWQIEQKKFALKTEVLMCVCLCFEDWKTSLLLIGFRVVSPWIESRKIVGALDEYLRA